MEPAWCAARRAPANARDAAAARGRYNVGMPAPKPPLTEADYRRAAGRLQCDLAAIMAVAKVEAPKGPFLPDGRPPILFERHKFHRHTRGRFSRSHPDLSNATPGGYGAGGAHQHDRLARAAALDREAALKSASWGAFQIMGENHAQAGHPTLQGFINAMYRSAAAQLDAFVSFNLADARLVQAIRGRMWATYARIYNGPAYRDNRYDEKLAAAYADFVKAYPPRPNFALVRSGVTSTETMR